MSNVEGEGGATIAGVKRAKRRMQRLSGEARTQAAALGHDLGTFEVEAEWHAAVATCKRCHLIAAVDLTESPYLFGRALKRKCK